MEVANYLYWMLVQQKMVSFGVFHQWAQPGHASLKSLSSTYFAGLR